MRVWAREVTATPSENLLSMARNIGVLRIKALQQFFAEFLGIEDYKDPRVGAAFMTAMSAVLIHMLIAPELRNIIIPGYESHPEQMKELVIRQVMAGLEARREDIAKEKAQTA